MDEIFFRAEACIGGQLIGITAKRGAHRRQQLLEGTRIGRACLQALGDDDLTRCTHRNLGIIAGDHSRFSRLYTAFGISKVALRVEERLPLVRLPARIWSSDYNL
jgi:hypothetical protein